MSEIKYKYGDPVIVLRTNPQSVWVERMYVAYVEEEPIFPHIVKDKYGNLESYEDADIRKKNDFLIHIISLKNKYQPKLIIGDQEFKIDYKCDTIKECEWMIEMLSKALNKITS